MVSTSLRPGLYKVAAGSGVLSEGRVKCFRVLAADSAPSVSTSVRESRHTHNVCTRT